MVPMKLTIQTARPYSVILENGLLDRVGEMALQTRKPGSQAMLISETNVYPLYGERVKASLEKAGFAVSTFVFPAGEASKQLSTVLEMYSALARQGFTRTDFIVTLGGGVTGDMGGFAAATFLRGMPFLQDGMGEVIKYGCISDKPLLEALEAGTALEDLEQLLARCVASKKSFVEEDTRDTGRRMILNFGHTFGHALEKLHNFQDLSHGEAVGIGMVLACQVGERLGVTPAGTGAWVAAVLERYGLPTQDSFSWEEIVEATALDKKSDGSTLRLILLTQLGEAAIYPVTRDRLKTLL